VGDFRRFVELVLSRSGPLSQEQRQELDAAITHMEKEAELGALPAALRCEVALRSRDFGTMESCTRVLATLAPNDPKTVSFEWALAVNKHDKAAAVRFLDRARQVGITSEGLAKMDTATRNMAAGRPLRLAAVMVAGLSLAFVLYAFAAHRQTSRRRASAV